MNYAVVNNTVDSLAQNVVTAQTVDVKLYRKTNKYKKGEQQMKKVIDEMKKHKKIMIGVAIVIVIGVWFMITNDPTPVVEG